MPWHLHPLGTPALDGDRFATKERAIRFLPDYKREDKASRYTITFIATPEQRELWCARERQRIYDYTYISLPWIDDDQMASDHLMYRNASNASGIRTPFYSNYDLKEQYWQATQNHFAHLSIDGGGFIAYTPDDIHGIEDRQHKIRPGKYFEKFTPFLTPQQREELCAIVRSMLQTSQFKIATSPHEIRAVYRHGHGFTSCMDVRNFDSDNDQNPVSVYGDSDLAVAYLGTIDGNNPRITSRCVVWPERKIYTRVYGDIMLESLLRRDGWKDGYSLRESGPKNDQHKIWSARVRAIGRSAETGLYVMPYIDACSRVRLTDDREWFECLGGTNAPRIDHERVFSSQPTEGFVGNAFTCHHCEARVVGTNDDNLCGSCRDLQWICNSCNDSSFDPDACYSHYNRHGRTVTYCEHCDGEHAITCQTCDETYYRDQLEIHLRNFIDDRGEQRCNACATSAYDTHIAELEARRQAAYEAERRNTRLDDNELCGHKCYGSTAPMIGDRVIVTRVGASLTIYCSDGVTFNTVDGTTTEHFATGDRLEITNIMNNGSRFIMHKVVAIDAMESGSDNASL